MSSRPLPFVAALVVGFLLVVFFWRPRGNPGAPASVGAPASATADRLLAAERSRSTVNSASATFESPSNLAAELNAPTGTIAGDLQILSSVMTDWRLNFPRSGNPVGDNAEITAALTGENPLRLPMIPRDHRAIDPAGELRDRWGTPFRFHALAGDRMEIRSAGPDRKFGTDDDAVLTPP